MKSGLLIFVIAAMLGLCLFIAGIYVLAGFGWCLLASSGAFMAIAGFVRKGLVSE